MIKTAHYRDENGTDIQEVVHCTSDLRRFVHIKRHGKFQGRDIYFNENGILRSEIFSFDQNRWDELAKAEIGATV